jgi:hypothetical protein
LRKRNGIRTVAGLCLPKALAPLLPIYLQVRGARSFRHWP